MTTGKSTTRFSAVESEVVVTEPSGAAYKQRIILAHDRRCNSFTIIPTSGVLKGYQIDAVISELRRAQEQGAQLDALPQP